MIDGGTLEHAYKYKWSDFTQWGQRFHADDWVLLPDNLGERLSIDESCLQDDLFTILSNKAGHGRQGTVIAMVRGTKASDVIEVLAQMPQITTISINCPGASFWVRSNFRADTLPNGSTWKS